MLIDLPTENKIGNLRWNKIQKTYCDVSDRLTNKGTRYKEENPHLSQDPPKKKQEEHNTGDSSVAAQATTSGDRESSSGVVPVVQEKYRFVSVIHSFVCPAKWGPLDIITECVPDRISVCGDHSKKVSLSVQPTLLQHHTYNVTPCYKLVCKAH